MIIQKLYINESFDEIDKSNFLLSHIAIDYILESQQYVLLEKYGVYDGCKELVDLIIKKAISKYKQNNTSFIIEIYRRDIKEFENVFFNKLIADINISNKVSDGAYINKKDDKLYNDIFDHIDFTFSINGESFEKDLRSLLYHELLHAYQNYCMKLTNNSMYDMLDNQKYSSLINAKNQSIDGVKQIISDVLYHMNNSEQNAYMSELRSDLENNKDVIHGPKDALDIIKDSIVYKNVMIAKDIIYGLTDNTYSENIQNRIYDIYRELNGCDWINNKIKKKLIDQIDKYIEKMEKTIPKMCMDFLNNNTIEIKETHNSKIINLKDYIKHYNS